MCGLTLKSVLNQAQPIKPFVYQQVRFSETEPGTIEVHVVPREGSRPVCSGCGQPGACYDHVEQRRWKMVPLWAFPVVLFYTMRRVQCAQCGVRVERVPWGEGKLRLCNAFRLFLAHWARKLSWQETAQSFGVGWADVYGSVQWVVDYGLAHRDLSGIVAIGVDEVCVRLGRVFWTLLYQIDEGRTRLLWIGHDRRRETLQAGLRSLGETVCASFRCVCSDMWAPYLAAVREQLPHVLHILDRFHIRKQMNEAINEIRKAEVQAMASAGLQPRLKRLRWALLKNRKNWTPKERRRMRALRQTGLASIRAYWLVAAFEHFWSYLSPSWAATFLDAWRRRVRRSRLAPLQTVADSLHQHRAILLNYFRAQKTISGGVIEGLNNKVKVTLRRSYGFRTDHAREVVLFHVLGKLPEPQVTHRFF
jgi:transposase